MCFLPCSHPTADRLLLRNFSHRWNITRCENFESAISPVFLSRLLRQDATSTRCCARDERRIELLIAAISWLTVIALIAVMEISSPRAASGVAGPSRCGVKDGTGRMRSALGRLMNWAGYPPLN